MKIKEITTTKTYSSQIAYLNDIILNHFNTINRKNRGIEKSVLAYYILHGITKETDDLIIEECFPNKNWQIAKQTISNIKSDLKKSGIITYNEISRTYSVNPPLNIDLEKDFFIIYSVKYRIDAGGVK